MKAAVLLTALGLGLALQGCGSVVVPTLAALSATSPLEADPAAFEVAASLPEGARVAENGIVFALEMSRSDTGEDASDEFILQRRETTDERVLFRIHPDDYEDLRAYQTLARTWEAEDPDATTGSISVSAIICSTGDGPDPDATFSVSVRTDVDGVFLPLIRNAKVSDALAQLDEDASLNDSPLCP